MSFGSHLRRLREHRGISQADLAGRTGFSRSTVSRLETDDREPTRDQLIELMDALDLGPMDRISFLNAAGIKIVSQLLEDSHDEAGPDRGRGLIPARHH